jgi:hypothetical protein
MERRGAALVNHVLDDLRLQVAERHIRRLMFQRDVLWAIV